jgi:uncharacterized alpha/beta hydrolase family protein
MFVKTEGSKITIEGNIAKFEDYDAIKLEVEEVRNRTNNSFTLVFRDAQSLISALVGYLIKLKRVDNVIMTIIAQNPKLYTMMDTLALVDVLNVRKG